MRMLARFFIKVKIKIKSDLKSKYIFYNIIEVSKNNEEYAIRCINTKAIFKQKITDIVLDVDVLHGLHPIQACYIGLEGGKYWDRISSRNVNQKMLNKNILISRYGNYVICYQTRSGDVCFMHKMTGAEYVMDPRDICLSEDILTEFDASHAFYIGLYAAMKRDTNSISISSSSIPKHPRLVVVK